MYYYVFVYPDSHVTSAPTMPCEHSILFFISVFHAHGHVILCNFRILHWEEGGVLGRGGAGAGTRWRSRKHCTAVVSGEITRRARGLSFNCKNSSYLHAARPVCGSAVQGTRRLQTTHWNPGGQGQNIYEEIHTCFHLPNHSGWSGSGTFIFPQIIFGVLSVVPGKTASPAQGVRSPSVTGAPTGSGPLWIGSKQRASRSGWACLLYDARSSKYVWLVRLPAERISTHQTGATALWKHRTKIINILSSLEEYWSWRKVRHSFKGSEHGMFFPQTTTSQKNTHSS